MVKLFIPVSLISILFFGCQTKSDKKAELTQAERDSFACIFLWYMQQRGNIN